MADGIVESESLESTTTTPTQIKKRVLEPDPVGRHREAEHGADFSRGAGESFRLEVVGWDAAGDEEWGCAAGDTGSQTMSRTGGTYFLAVTHLTNLHRLGLGPGLTHPHPDLRRRTTTKILQRENGEV